MSEIKKPSDQTRRYPHKKVPLSKERGTFYIQEAGDVIY